MTDGRRLAFSIPASILVRTKTAAQADKILAAAAKLFASHHFHQARMEDIAEAAAVGKGTLYRYFKDKEELYMALLNRVAEEWTERVSAAAEVQGARAKLEAVVTAIIEFCDEHPHVIDLAQHAEVMQGPDADLPSQRIRRDNTRLIENIFEEAHRGGEFQVADPALAARLLIGGLRPIIRCGAKPRPRDLAGRIVDMVLSGAARPACGCPSHSAAKRG
jgi:AcrR family transcriptional regulator